MALQVCNYCVPNRTTTPPAPTIAPTTAPIASTVTETAESHLWEHQQLLIPVLIRNFRRNGKFCSVTTEDKLQACPSFLYTDYGLTISSTGHQASMIRAWHGGADRGRASELLSAELWDSR